MADIIRDPATLLRFAAVILLTVGPAVAVLAWLRWLERGRDK